ncbi:hypothetical protein CRG98_035549 [Punica granatum]|uniref:Uncharacterized protein n=1 Tax=Punica granatum TaxID=22663 RepID=A0A2I0IJB5_PUNGR|nr:hypothetical protein CRG98_035549 [Punica granatum]
MALVRVEAAKGKGVFINPFIKRAMTSSHAVPLGGIGWRACVESVIRVMPLTRVATDVFGGVATSCLVALLIPVGYSAFFTHFTSALHIHSRGYIQLTYFSGPWIIRIRFILFAIWWGLGEIIRLSLSRREGKVLDALNFKWQETVCKGYIVSYLGLCTYPFLSTIFLGLFAAVLTAYLFWLGRPTLKLVLNKGLWKRGTDPLFKLSILVLCCYEKGFELEHSSSCTGRELVVPEEAVEETTLKAVNEPVVAAEAADDELATNDAKDAAKAEVPAAGVDALVVVVTVEELETGEEANEKDVDFVAGALEAAVAGAEDAAMLNPKEDCQNLTFF